MNKDVEIERFIPYGKGCAVSQSYLASLLNMNEREVRHLIHTARSEGALILSDNAGFYRVGNPPSDEEIVDLRRCVHRLRKMGLGTLLTACFLRKRLREAEEACSGQLAFPECRTEGYRR